MTEQFDRTSLLLGETAVKKLHSACVAVFGLGGVGSFVVEALARAGVGKLVLVDNDVIAKSNLNRQLFALHSTLGKKKTTVACQRVKDINPNCTVEEYPVFFDQTTKDGVELWGVDYLVDCIDSVKSKVLICQTAKQLNAPVIMALGTGNKLCNTAFEVCNVQDTSVCPLARVMRKELKAVGIENVKVVFSKEPPKTQVVDKVIPSISTVPSVAGLIIANEVIKDLVGL